MKITDRYRQITTQAQQIVNRFNEQPDGKRIDRAVRQLEKGHAELKELEERVGEIPQIHLEAKLTPVLLHAHGTFDRARVLYEDNDQIAEGAQIWEVEQGIYRLLNDL